MNRMFRFLPNRLIGQLGRMDKENGKWLIGAIDSGTTSARMLIFDELGKLVCFSQKRVQIHSPLEGWAEHDPNEIIASVRECMAECGRMLSEMGLLKFVKSIGLAVHRESILAFDQKTGQNLSNVILWLDTRTQDIVREYDAHKTELTAKTGLKLSTYFSAFKMKWLMRNLNLSTDYINFATADAWLLYNLTGEYKTDLTNASRTMLLNLKTKEYDPDLLNLFGIGIDQLPKVCPTIHNFGVVKDGAFAGIPITAVFGDQQASLLGQRCIEKGEIKCTLGTGAFILMNCGDDMPITNEFITTIISDGRYGLEAPIAVAASGLNWFREKFNFCPKFMSSDGVLFVPALTGLLSPFWRPDLNGSFHNLTLRSTPDNMATAILESIAFSVALCIEILREKYSYSITSLKVDGGLSNDRRLLQMICDASGIKVLSPEMKECTALGAAIGAANGMGMEIDCTAQNLVTLEPKMSGVTELFKKWKDLMRWAANKDPLL
jgi:glycerol kinase